MPEKKVINVRLVKGKSKRKTRAKKPKEKARQKQKQRQVVNVQVSSGGSGGGGTSFIPMPQAPAFDYSLLASLIRPANTVDMPIRAMAPIPEPVQVRPAEEPTLAEAKKQRVPVSLQMSEREAGYESFPTSSGEEATRQEVRRQEKAALEIMGRYSGIPKSFRIKKGESEQEAMVRYQQYLADKSGKGRMATFEKKKAEVLSKLPAGEVTAFPTASATFIGERDIFGGEK
jgi:hypothetical protein